MLFNSYVFIFIFFPLVFLGYRVLVSLKRYDAGKCLLVLASLYFYSYFKWDYLPLLVVSILVNFGLCRGIQNSRNAMRKIYTVAGCLLNLGILGYFKYTGFLVDNVNSLLGTHWHFTSLVLPLGISFYTFQQLSFLIDCYRGDRTKYTLLDYALFVTFFPQLIAGPIVLPGEMLPQFEDPSRRAVNWENLNTGLFLFVCGLAKKCVIADSLAIFSDTGFDSTTCLTTAESWLVSLSFTFQLYFDFSGYCDMATGIAKWFNLDLPQNFNSPYRATDFQDFWRRWHITLGRFMMNYLYIPLGGNRKGKIRTLVNLLIVFLVSGLWHGAGWLFLIWGGLHGVCILIHRVWHQMMEKYGKSWQIPRIPAILITFFFVNIFWVFFRATTLERAFSILHSMFDFTRISGLSTEFKNATRDFDFSRDQICAILITAAILAFFVPNAMVCSEWLKKHPAWRILLTVFFGTAGFLCLRRISPFLYFNF